MSRYIGPVCRKCRRARVKLFLKGEKCFSSKCPFEKDKNFQPGQHGKKPVKISEYGRRLREKQKLKNILGITETQLYNYFKKAKSMKGVAGENLLKILEMRLDNVVYRLGWASSRRFARQIVSHKHILVNGKPVNIPSYLLKVGDKIQLIDGMQENIYVQKSMEISKEIPSWIKYDKENFTAEIIALPTKEECSFPVDEKLIVEFYSK